MEQRTLRVLEYNKIIDQLVGATGNPMSAALARDTVPLDDADDIRKSLQLTCETRDMLIKRGTPRMSGFKDVTPHISRAMLGGALSMRELLDVADALRIARNLHTYHKGEGELAIDEYFNAISTDNNLEREINEIIISEEQIADNASPQLLAIRRQILNQHQKIRNALDAILRSQHYQKILQDNIVTLRDGRYVVPVKAESKSEMPGIVHDMSQSGATYFVEPAAVVDANNALRELAMKEQLEIERILSALTAQVADIAELLRNNQKVIVELDVIFAKGQLAVRMDAHVPEVRSDGYVSLRKARHPLIGSKCIPITIEVGGEFRQLIVTGPNTGGKTVALKTVGLMCAMACAGMLVPCAEGSCVSLFDNIFADIGDEQSIEQSLSTFSSHMSNIVHILSNVSPQSLVLLDELGAGTDPTEGAALSVAILQYLGEMQCRVVATTHYAEIKMYALGTPGVCNAACEFDEQTMRPTYNILIGVPGKSNAMSISRRLGLPEFIIQNAMQHLTHEAVSFEDVISQLDANRRASEEKQRELTRLQNEQKRLTAELEKQRDALAHERAKIASTANEQAKRLTDAARREIDQMMTELKALQKSDANTYARKLHESRHKLVKKQREAERATVVEKVGTTHEPLDQIMPGMSVYVIDIGQEATVVDAPKSNGEVRVQAGIIKITTHVDNLRKGRGADQPKVRSVTAGGGLRLDAAASTSLDLRGLYAEEALARTDKFLDSAVRNGLHEVTIIHGKGTGALRKAVTNMLKEHPLVKQHRLGEYGEGDSGITVVYL